MELVVFTRRSRAGVRAYLFSAFAVCLLALGALLATTTASSFGRERNRAATVLRAAAQDNAHWADQTMPSALAVLQSVTTQAGITGFNPVECAGVFSGLASVTGQGHLHLLRSDGSQVCSLRAPDVPDREIPGGSWFNSVRESHEPVNGGTAVDPLTGHASVTVALPVDGPDGQVGVLAAVLYTDSTPLDLPAGAPEAMVLIEVSPDRSLVLGTSADAPVKAGPVTAPWLSRPLPHGGQTLVDADGVTRLYREVTAPGVGWHLLAGLPRSVALGPAERELHRNLWLALAVLLLVVGLGLNLQRSLARPARRLRAAIEAAGTDDGVRAPVEGPAEMAAVAEAFNATIARRRELEQELVHQALHDPLTGLPNRALLADRLNQAVARRARHGGAVLVAFMDLDRFKVINDSKGHPAGDALLVALARRLETTLRAGDTVARFGGDEFVVVSEGADGPGEAKAIAERLAAALKEPFAVAGEEIRITGSVGVAVGRGGESGDDLIRNADAAMYEAKERERGGWALYRDRIHSGVMSRLETECELHRALEQEAFQVHYQPKYSLASADVVGVEALVRWLHPTRGLVSPADFIPICEETGLILPLGDWVLGEAARQSQSWRVNDGLHIAVSVNLSARQLMQPDLTRRVEAVLTRTGLDPADLCLEITEGTLLVDMTAAVRHLTALRGLGVRVSIDDFGTGYSSLAYLRTLPLDELKIDRSFVTSVADDPAAAAIVASVVSLGHALGLVVVAEGAETAEQLAALRELGCDLAQGYHLGRPAPAGQLTPLLRRSTAATWSPDRPDWRLD